MESEIKLLELEANTILYYSDEERAKETKQTIEHNKKTDLI